MNSNELLAAEYMDLEFEYPQEYIDFLSNMSLLGGAPWWLIGTSKGFFKSCYEYINIEQKSKKFLIPFAKCDETNILACFDTSHRICFCGLEDDDIANVDWEERASLPNFNIWIKRVMSGDL